MRAFFKDEQHLVVNYLDLNEVLIAKQFLKLLEDGKAKIEPIYNDHDNVGGLRILVKPGTHGEELDISDNGRFDVRDYDYVNVDVEPVVSGEIDITDNGVYDVSQYATANVNVQGGSEYAHLTPQDITNLNNIVGELFNIQSDMTEEEALEQALRIASGV